MDYLEGCSLHAARRTPPRRGEALAADGAAHPRRGPRRSPLCARADGLRRLSPRRRAPRRRPAECLSHLRWAGEAPRLRRREGEQPRAGDAGGRAEGPRPRTWRPEQVDGSGLDRRADIFAGGRPCSARSSPASASGTTRPRSTRSGASSRVRSRRCRRCTRSPTSSARSSTERSPADPRGALQDRPRDARRARRLRLARRSRRIGRRHRTASRASSRGGSEEAERRRRRATP